MTRLAAAALGVVLVVSLFSGTAQASVQKACVRDTVRGTIWCATHQWPVPGGAPKAVRVARCESGLNPNAYYANNGGVFQQNLTYWPGRQDGYQRATGPRWSVVESVYNARANVLVSIRMAHFGGWGPWSCA